MKNGYDSFLKSKLGETKYLGIDSPLREYHLFPHEQDLASWALRRGVAAIFADTGLGKTAMQLAWADTIHRTVGCDVFILTPLAVAEQTVREGVRIGVHVTHVRENSDVVPGINITNYDRLHKFDTSRFGAVVLDESGIIKHVGSKTFQTLCDVFQATPYKLACTATPAPNDWTELGNHAEFLGIRSRSEMLAEFFVHDGGNTSSWRLKGHARKAFWHWLASWAAVIRSPEDLGHDGAAYILKPLHIHHHIVESPPDLSKGLFTLEAQTLMERRQARKKSTSKRTAECASIVNASKDPWLVWCELNTEGDELERAIPDAIQVAGADSNDIKEERLRAFINGQARVLVTKPSIAGFGLNLQHCANIAFVGVTDSFESYYQAVRRCWRFGQEREVHVHIFASDAEGAVVANLQRKERDAKVMADAMADETRAEVQKSVLGSVRNTDPYIPSTTMHLPSFL